MDHLSFYTYKNDLYFEGIDYTDDTSITNHVLYKCNLSTKKIDKMNIDMENKIVQSISGNVLYCIQDQWRGEEGTWMVYKIDLESGKMQEWHTIHSDTPIWSMMIYQDKVFAATGHYDKAHFEILNAEDFEQKNWTVTHGLLQPNSLAFRNNEIFIREVESNQWLAVHYL